MDLKTQIDHAERRHRNHTPQRNERARHLETLGEGGAEPVSVSRPAAPAFNSLDRRQPSRSPSISASCSRDI